MLKKLHFIHINVTFEIYLLLQIPSSVGGCWRKVRKKALYKLYRAFSLIRREREREKEREKVRDEMFLHICRIWS